MEDQVLATGVEDHAFLFSAIAIFSSLTLATIIHAICKKLKISFPIGLLVGGLLLAFAVDFFEITAFEHFSFSPDIVFYVFLPTLIFESAYNMNFRQFRGVIGDVTLMAIFGLVISTFIVAGGLNYALDLPWGPSFLFGALISATDPVAVLAVFKDLKAPKRLSTIVEGESLLNDGTGLILFNFIKGVVIAGSVVLNKDTFFSATNQLFISLVEGIAVGSVLGWIFAHAISKSRSNGVQITLSLILAHATFLFAEGILHVSGILATMMAGLIMGNFGRRKLTAKTKEIFMEIWEFMGFVANSLIFLLLGMQFARIDFIAHWKLVLVSAVLVILIARPISVFMSFAISNLFRKPYKKICFKYQTIAFWGGIRGALAAVSVLMIPSTYEYFPELLAMTGGTILATFFLNVTTIPLLLKKLKFIDFTISEKIQQFEAKILIDEEVLTYLQHIKKQDYMAEQVFLGLKESYSKAEKDAIEGLKKLQHTLQKKSSREVEKILMYHALAIEKKCYGKLFEKHEVPEKLFCVLRESILRQMDRLDRDELPDERKSPIKYAPEIPKEIPELNKIPTARCRRFSQKLFRKFRHKKILQRLYHYRASRIASAKVIADFEKLLKHHAIFGDKSTLEKILKRYDFWHNNAQKKVDKLEVDFPGIIIPARVRIAKHSCFKKEHECQKGFHEKGLISDKVYLDLEKNLVKKIDVNLGL